MKRLWTGYGCALRFFFRSIPLFTVADLLLCAVTSALDAFTMVYTFRVVIQIFETGRSYGQAAAFLGTLFCANLLCHLLNALCEGRYRPVAMKRLQSSVETELFRMASVVELRKYDQPAFYQDMYWAMLHGYETLEQVMQSLEKLCKALSSILSLLLIVWSIDTVALCIVAVSVIGGIAAQSRRNHLAYRRDMEVAGYEHKIEYIDKLFYQKEYLKEMRVQGFGDFFLRQFHGQCEQTAQTVKRYGRREAGLAFLQNFFLDAFPIYIIYTGYLVYQVGVAQVFSLADFTSLFTSIDVLKNNVMWLSRIASEAQKHALYMEKLRGVLTQERFDNDGEEGQELKAVHSIEFSHVGFSYEGKAPALRDICLTVSEGEKVALVGYNGAGKTTLLKLLLRLYSCESGAIRINGRDIADYSFRDWMSHTACVFQDVRLLPVSIAENVAMAEIYDEAKVKRCLQDCGMLTKVEALPQGIHTVITEEYADQGTGLSGGELQKIAVAQALYQGAELLILDEPASAMDPAGEYEFNRLIRGLNRTLLIVSHRLTTTYFMDQIVLMKEGEIRERGTHAQLMAQRGDYYRLYCMQAKKYQTQL